MVKSLKLAIAIRLLNLWSFRDFHSSPNYKVFRGKWGTPYTTGKFLQYLERILKDPKRWIDYGMAYDWQPKKLGPLSYGLWGCRKFYIWELRLIKRLLLTVENNWDRE